MGDIMREELRKLNGETNLEYASRLYDNKVLYNLSNKEIYELYKAESGDTRAESSIRCESATYLKGFSQGFEKALQDRQDTELLSELEEKEIALKEERVRLSDMRRKLNKQIRDGARYKSNIEVLEDCIYSLENTKPFIVKSNLYEFGNNVAVLNFSDLHAGINIDNYFNKYNMEICRDRVVELTQKSIDRCAQNRVNKIHLLINGDLISGSIRKSLVADADVSLVSSITMASEIISNMIYEFSNYIEDVSVHMTIGNHSRMNPNKHEHIEKDNFEYLIFEFIKLRLRHLKNVKFEKNTYTDDISDFKIGANTYFATHGDKDTPKLVASKITGLTGIKPRAIFCGHLHHYISEDFNGCMVKFNGSVVGTDDYATSLRLNSEPYQLLTIYDIDGNEECEYKIRLN